MALPDINPTTTVSWNKLLQHFNQIQHHSISEMFANDKLRADKFHVKWNDFLVDYSKNRINQETLSLLLELASEMKLKNAIDDYFSGETINKTENRAVLHTALRSSKNDTILVDGKNIVPEIFEVKEKIKVFSENLEVITEKFDLITMFDLLEHVMDPLKLIEQSKEALENQSRVVIESKIRNTDRSTGTMLTNEITKKYGHSKK